MGLTLSSLCCCRSGRFCLLSCLRACFSCLVSVVFLEPTSKSKLGNNGKEVFPLKERVVDEFDFVRAMAMSDFLIIFPSDNSTVVFDAFIVFWLS